MPVVPVVAEEVTVDAVNLPTGIGEDFVPGAMLVRYHLFVNKYLETGSPVDAAKEAGWTSPSKQGMAAIVRTLTSNPFIVKLLQDGYRSIIAKTGATVDRVWEEITYAAFLDPGVFYRADGSVKAMNEIPEEARRAITGMKIKEGTIGEDGEFIERELKYQSKDAALEKLMRLHRMVDQDKLVIIDGAELLERMEAARERVANRQ